MTVPLSESSRRWKRYPKYKDSGVEWLGNVPEGWKIKRIKRAAQIISGQSPPEETYNTEGIGTILINGPAEYSESDFGLTRELKWTSDPKKIAPANCLLFCLRGSTTGRLNITHTKVSIGRGVAALCVKEGQKFLNYSMLAMKEFVLGTSNGSTFPSITSETLGMYSFGIPPYFEQSTIAAFLDRETARIVALIAKKERQIELLEEKRAALISHAVTKGLDPNAKMKDSGVEWLGEVPERWEILHLGWVSYLIVPMRDKPPEFNGDIPWIRIEDFNGKYISDSKSDQRVSAEIVNKMNLKIFPVGTVLCSCSCNMGSTAIVAKPLISNQTFIGIVPKKELDSIFVYYLMSASGSWLQSIGSGAIQQYLSRDEFSHLKLALPPLPEQTAIAAFLDRETAKIDNLIQLINESMEKLREYRTALISAAVTGKIDVRGEVQA